jgi:hypothetical protein
MRDESGRKMSIDEESIEELTSPRSRADSIGFRPSRKNSRADLLAAFFPDGIKLERRVSQEDVWRFSAARARSTSATSTEAERVPSPVEFEKDLVIVKNPLWGQDIPHIGYNTFSGSSGEPKIFSSKSLPKRITLDMIRGVFKKDRS